MPDVLDLIYSAKPIAATGQQWMAKEEEKDREPWTNPTAAPASDPFAVKPWRGVEIPKPVALKPSPWLATLYNGLQASITKGYELLDQPGLADELRQKYLSRIEQLCWQTHLLETVLRELAPCHPNQCSCRLGGIQAGQTSDSRDRVMYDLRQAQAAGQVAIKITTPGGREYHLVPWRTDPPVPGELDPLDMAALARVAALNKIDELALLDKLEVSSCSPSSA